MCIVVLLCWFVFSLGIVIQFNLWSNNICLIIVIQLNFVNSSLTIFMPGRDLNRSGFLRIVFDVLLSKQCTGNFFEWLERNVFPPCDSRGFKSAELHQFERSNVPWTCLYNIIAAMTVALVKNTFRSVDLIPDSNDVCFTMCTMLQLFELRVVGKIKKYVVQTWMVK